MLGNLCAQGPTSSNMSAQRAKGGAREGPRRGAKLGGNGQLGGMRYWVRHESVAARGSASCDATACRTVRHRGNGSAGPRYTQNASGVVAPDTGNDLMTDTAASGVAGKAIDNGGR